jgi:hypothetical protein
MVFALLARVLSLALADVDEDFVSSCTDEGGLRMVEFMLRNLVITKEEFVKLVDKGIKKFGRNARDQYKLANGAHPKAWSPGCRIPALGAFKAALHLDLRFDAEEETSERFHRMAFAELIHKGSREEDVTVPRVHEDSAVPAPSFDRSSMPSASMLSDGSSLLSLEQAFESMILGEVDAVAPLPLGDISADDALGGLDSLDISAIDSERLDASAVSSAAMGVFGSNELAALELPARALETLHTATETAAASLPSEQRSASLGQG